MSAPAVDLRLLDDDIALAWVDVQSCRAAWARSPNPQTIAAEQDAVRHLDKLLDFRFLVQRRQ